MLAPVGPRRATFDILLADIATRLQLSQVANTNGVAPIRGRLQVD